MVTIEFKKKKKNGEKDVYKKRGDISNPIMADDKNKSFKNKNKDILRGNFIMLRGWSHVVNKFCSKRGK